MKTNTIILYLNDEEIELLREAVSELGLENSDYVTLQLKVANAILDSDYLSPPIQQVPYCEYMNTNGEITREVMGDYGSPGVSKNSKIKKGKK